MKEANMKEANMKVISLTSSEVEFDCESEVPPSCPETIDVEINLPKGANCKGANWLVPPRVTIKLDGKETESPLKPRLKAKVVAREK